MDTRRPLLSGPATGLLIDLAYLALVLVLLPRLLWKLLATDRYRASLGQRLLGRYPRRLGERPCLWLHAVSLGEVRALRPLVEALDRELPAWELAITSTTRTGFEAAQRLFPGRYLAYSPLDLSPVVARAFDAIRPRAVVYVELDLWPNALREARRRQVPLALVNGRMSPRSFGRYRRARPWVRRVFGWLELLLVQEPEHAARFAALGLDPARIEVTGNLKADALPAPDAALRAATRAELGWGPEVLAWVGGSTSSGEEDALLDAYQALAPGCPALRLALGLRHPERAGEVEALVRQRGLPVRRRSAGDAPAAGAVWLWDTVGELVSLYQAADLAFVGGSLMPRGGQNLLEPAALGLPVLIGPHHWNVRDAVERLSARDAVRVVADGPALTAAAAALLADPGARAALGQRARELAAFGRGASELCARRLAALLETARGPGTTCRTPARTV